MVVTSECDSMVWLKIGGNLHLPLEILPVGPTELGSDLHPTPRFSGRCGNAPRTMFLSVNELIYQRRFDQVWLGRSQVSAVFSTRFSLGF